MQFSQDTPVSSKIRRAEMPLPTAESFIETREEPLLEKKNRIISEIVLKHIYEFLVKNGGPSDVRFAGLNIRPITQEVCLKAFTLINQFGIINRFAIKIIIDEKSTYESPYCYETMYEVDDYLRPKKMNNRLSGSYKISVLIISKFAFNSLRIYSGLLRLKQNRLEESSKIELKVIEDRTSSPDSGAFDVSKIQIDELESRKKSDEECIIC